MTYRNVAAALLLLTLAATAQAAPGRRRAVRAPAPECSFALTVGFGPTVSASGLEDGGIHVVGSPSTCTSWTAHSLTDWVTVARAGNAVVVDVAPNPTTTSRIATLLIAGITYELVQGAADQPVSPPLDGNLLLNPGFDRELAPWGWQARFPNGLGSATWSSADAANSPTSGSIRIRNDRPTNEGPGYQQLQCAAVEAGEVYLFGGRFLASSTTAGSAIFAVVEYADEGCADQAVRKDTKIPRASAPAVWDSRSYTIRFGFDTKSVLVVIGSYGTTAGSFEVFIDDVFLRKR